MALGFAAQLSGRARPSSPSQEPAEEPPRIPEPRLVALVSEIRDAVRDELKSHLKDVQQAANALIEQTEASPASQVSPGAPKPAKPLATRNRINYSAFREADAADAGVAEQAPTPAPSQRQQFADARRSGTKRFFDEDMLADVALPQKASMVNIDAGSASDAQGHRRAVLRRSMLSPVRRFREALDRCVESNAFDIFSAFAICVNTALIGVETDYLAQYGHSTTGLHTGQVALNMWYIVELFMRLGTQRCKFFYGKDLPWNFFDVLMVAFTIVDSAIAQGNRSMQVGRTIRLIRLVRILRAIRIIRTLRQLREFRKMIFALAMSMQTLIWSLFLLCSVVYTFAVWLTQGVANYKSDFGPDLNTDPHPHHGTVSKALEEYYGTLGKSIYTLYQCVTAGLSWGYAAYPLLEVGGVYLAIFIVFVSVTAFGVLNIITSVFVESAMQSARHSRDLMSEEKNREKKLYVTHLKKLFKEIDLDGSGVVSEEELDTFLSDEGNMGDAFLALEINSSDARRLFKLLDADDSGEVDMEEFCEGCLQVKGEASSFDVNCIIYEHRKMQKWMAKFMSHVEDELMQIVSGNDEKDRLMHQAVSRISQLQDDYSPRKFRGEALHDWRKEEEAEEAECAQESPSRILHGKSPPQLRTGRSNRKLPSLQIRQDAGDSGPPELPQSKCPPWLAKEVQPEIWSPGPPSLDMCPLSDTEPPPWA